MVGRIIGKGGETIKDLQKRFNASIQIDQACTPCKVTIIGAAHTIHSARRAVEDLVRQTNAPTIGGKSTKVAFMTPAARNFYNVDAQVLALGLRILHPFLIHHILLMEPRTVDTAAMGCLLSIPHLLVTLTVPIRAIHRLPHLTVVMEYMLQLRPIHFRMQAVIAIIHTHSRPLHWLHWRQDKLLHVATSGRPCKTTRAVPITTTTILV